MGKFTKDKRVLKTYLYSKKDVYYRKAKEDGFRARSAYKLLQLDEEFNIFTVCERVIDLCAAPGSWSQVVSKKLTEKGLFKQGNEETRVISVDLQEMAPIENTIQIQGDITKQETVDMIMKDFKGNKAELVICDGAPDVTGFHDIDQYIQSQLIVAALNIANLVLKSKGIFLAKIFKGHDVEFLYSQFKLYFNSVYIIKPKSSRSSSVEAFIVCLDYAPPYGFIPKKLSTFSENKEKNKLEEEKVSEEEEKLIKFTTCGDLSGFDEI